MKDFGQCADCDQAAVGIDCEGTPYCAKHYRRRVNFCMYSCGYRPLAKKAKQLKTEVDSIP